MKLTIQAKSSGQEPYNVEFLVEEDRLSVYCNCQAGNFGKLCKHKTELLAGDASRLFDETEVSKLEQLKSLVARAPEITQLANEIAETEKIIRRKQARVKQAKKEFERKLKQGVDLN